jgi:hypothetical protein
MHLLSIDLLEADISPQSRRERKGKNLVPSGKKTIGL